MKVALVITRSDTVAGAQIHVRELAVGLIARGHEATVLVGGRGRFVDDLERHGIPWVSLRHLIRQVRPHTDVRAFLELRSHLRRLQPDIVAAHSSKAGWLARFAARSVNVPAIFTAHGWAFTENVHEPSRTLYRLAERIAGRVSARIITVSEFDRCLAVAAGIASPRHIVVAHYGRQDVAPDMRSRPEAEPPQIIMVARFEPQKDHETLLRALAALKDRPWRLELVGEGPGRAGAERLSAEIGIADRINFAGECTDVPRRLADSQIFVLTTNWEGFPISILEAMRAGLPVIATDVCGVREEVQDGRTGYLVRHASVDDAAARLAALIAAPSLRRSMGDGGRAVFVEHFTADRMVDRTIEIYQSVLEQRRQ